MRRQRYAVGIVAVVVLCWTGSALAGGAKPPKPTKAQRCEAAKNKVAGEKAECLAEERAKEVLGKTPNYAKCEQAFINAFAKAEQKAGAGVCPRAGDVVAIEGLVDACMADVADALAGLPLDTCTQAPAQLFPATGQTGCWDSNGTAISCTTTGQDGEIQAGATLSYTDNGDGTITDNNTGLIWAKKSDDGSIHHFVLLLERLGPPPQILWVTCGNTSYVQLRDILLKSFPEARACLEQGEPLVEISDAR